MSRSTAWAIHLCTLVLGVGGLAWAWIRYGMTAPEDEFALYNHPSEPWLRDGHVLVAPLILFLWGLVWRSHVWARIVVGVQQRRRTGLLLAGLVLPLALSGYALQVAVDEAWREAWLVLHLGTGAVFTLGYAIHQFGPRLRPKSAKRS